MRTDAEREWLQIRRDLRDLEEQRRELLRRLALIEEAIDAQPLEGDHSRCKVGEPG